MAQLDWNDSYSTGLDELDDDHRQLIKIINDFDTARADGRGEAALGGTLKAAHDYAKNHFAHEEGLMKKHGFPGLAEHASMHRQ